MFSVQDWKSPVSELDAEKLLKLQMGAISPMWMAFAGVATMGAAMWSASHWMRLAGGARPGAQPQTPAAPVESTAGLSEAVAPVQAALVAPVVPAPALAAAAPQLKAPKAKVAKVAKTRPATIKTARTSSTPVVKIDGRTKAARMAKAARLAETGGVQTAKPAAGKRRPRASAAR